MKAFWRVFEYIWPQWPRLVVILVCSVLISILFSLSFMTIIPLLKLMMGEEGLHGWADRKVCERRYGVRFYTPDRIDFIDPNKPDIANYLIVTKVEAKGLAYASGLRLPQEPIKSSLPGCSKNLLLPVITRKYLSVINGSMERVVLN